MALNLIPTVLQRLADRRRPAVFGVDYPTPGGACVRGFVRVEDLASAHVAGLEYSDRGERLFDVFDVGPAVGHSVREAIDAIGKATGLDVTPDDEPRRGKGDPAILIGDVGRIERVFGWKARHGLTSIVDSAWRAWQTGPRRFAV
ncbi:MAG: hypothetical protein LBE08_10025 [Bifidobacteriaceae bacterium]|nr:hypothetical protein [Bifidobacteriaceae bacterium]